MNFIKKILNGYAYFGKPKQDNNYAFDTSYFDSLITNREYDKAADYAELYHYDDPDEQAAHEQDIIELRRQGHIVGAIYSKLQSSPSTLKKVEFADNISNPAGLANLVQRDENGNYVNEYAGQAKEALDAIGNYGDKKATSLGVTFKPAKRALFGLDFLDWAMKDNENTIDNFYKKSKLTKEQLQDAGVKIIEKDGYTTLKFSKDNEYAIDILSNIDNEAYNLFNNDADNLNPDRVFTDDKTLITGYTEDDKPIIRDGLETLAQGIYSMLPMSARVSAGGMNIYPATFLPRLAMNTLANKGNLRVAWKNTPIAPRDITATDVFGKNEISQFRLLVDDAVKSKEEAFKENELDDYVISGVIGPQLSDGLDELNARHDRGEIDNTTYYKEREILLGNLESMVRGGLDPAQTIYSDLNSKGNDPTMETLELDDKQKIITMLKDVDAKRLTYNAYAQSNGTIGTLITVSSDPNIKGVAKAVYSFIGEKPIQIFIPNLFTEQVQKKLDSRTDLRAIQEVNDMKRYGYDYKLVNGESVKIRNDIDGIERYYLGDREINKDAAIREINKDKIKDGIAKGLKYNFINNRNELIETDSRGLTYEENARLAAVKAANELYPNVESIGLRGDRYSVDDIFNYMATPDDKTLVTGEFESKEQYELYRKVNDIFDIYRYIMSGINYYKN